MAKPLSPRGSSGKEHLKTLLHCALAYSLGICHNQANIIFMRKLKRSLKPKIQILPRFKTGWIIPAEPSTSRSILQQKVIPPQNHLSASHEMFSKHGTEG